MFLRVVLNTEKSTSIEFYVVKKKVEPFLYSHTRSVKLKFFEVTPTLEKLKTSQTKNGTSSNYKMVQEIP